MHGLMELLRPQVAPEVKGPTRVVEPLKMAISPAEVQALKEEGPAVTVARERMRAETARLVASVKRKGARDRRKGVANGGR